MTDLEIIEQFKKQSSEEGTIVEVELVSGERKQGVDYKSLIYFPLHWEDFDTLKDSHLEYTIREFCQKRDALLGLIIWGNPSSTDVERIFRSCPSSPDALIVDFIDVQGRLWKNKLLCQGSDGLDLPRTFENVTKNGLEADPIWQWDSKTDC